MRKLVYLLRTLLGAIKFHGIAFYKFKILVVNGSHNFISVGRNSTLKNPELVITGTGNTLTIGDNVVMGPGCKIILQGRNCSISIGNNCTFTRLVEFNVQEDNMSITIGNDCMFSNHIIVRTSDSHIMYDKPSGKRLNPPKSVTIGEHVWIAPNTKIMKGAVIGSGSIIGSDTTITKHVPDNTLCIGRPSKIIRENVEWSRKKLF